ncbi:MAG: hypothetical protein SX243_11940 [Acidobacteriota bacterium]|nr:hypothetical protein [Acidobacteriota bacterium]
MASEPRVLCETPTPGKQPVTIPEWKYRAVADAILAVVPVEEPGIPFQELPDAVADRLPQETRQRLGSVAWHVTTVKLDLEVKGKVRRLKAGGRQHLVRG